MTLRVRVVVALAVVAEVESLALTDTVALAERIESDPVIVVIGDALDV